MQLLVTAAMVRCTRKRRRVRADAQQDGRTTDASGGNGNSRARWTKEGPSCIPDLTWCRSREPGCCADCGAPGLRLPSCCLMQSGKCLCPPHGGCTHGMQTCEAARRKQPRRSASRGYSRREGDTDTFRSASDSKKGAGDQARRNQHSSLARGSLLAV